MAKILKPSKIIRSYCIIPGKITAGWAVVIVAGHSAEYRRLMAGVAARLAELVGMIAAEQDLAWAEVPVEHRLTAA